jgi:hypothetical protein
MLVNGPISKYENVQTYSDLVVIQKVLGFQD